MLALSLSFLLLVLVNGGYVRPPWYDRIKAEFDAVGKENVKRCFKREDVPPTVGDICAESQKTCFFGTQTCTNGLLHPVTKCVCPGKPNTQWGCAPEECPPDNGGRSGSLPSETTLESNNIDLYPGYSGALRPVGSVKVNFFKDNSMQFSYDMSGLPANCDKCGVHIHTGVTCAAADQVLDHYWDTSEQVEDPWVPGNGAFYNTDANGDGKGFFPLFSGFNYTENIGHTVVFHAQNGSRIGCGTLMTRDLQLNACNFDRYPGYTGSLEPAGSVKVNFLPDKSMLFAYDMAGLPANCVGCGVHIHTGVTCAAADQVLGHYWDKSEQAADPWTPAFGAIYSTNAKGEAKGFFPLFSGFNFAENIGHAVVFHAQDGSRIGCGTLMTLDTMLESDNIAVYPGYSGGLIPAGSVEAKFLDDDSMLFSYDMAGLPANCDECGVHIHSGVTCAAADQVLGHYWDVSEPNPDPWVPSNGAFYNTDSTGDGKGFFPLSSGFNYTENIGHAVVFHAQDGSRIGCGTLVMPENTLEAYDIDTYPGYTGSLKPSGSVKVKFLQDDSMVFSYDMSGLPTNCVDCGVHIHSGATCAAADQVLGHYWDVSEQVEDPWTPAFGAAYSTDANGDGKGFFPLFSGFNFTENIGHAVVFHAQDGSRIGCGTLMTRDLTLQSDNIDTYPGYAGSLEPAGSVKVKFLEDDSMLFSYDMVGLPANCVDCGVHIHTGTTCDVASQVLGHYWDVGEQVQDPWTAAFGAAYSTNANGEAKGFFPLFTGFNFAENAGHAVVFHAQNGTRIGCGTLSNTDTTLESDNIGIYPGYAGSLKPVGSVKANFLQVNSMLFSYDMAGLPASCDKCGVHIHAGVTCAAADQVLGHYWDINEPKPDPWVASNGAFYNTDATGDAKGFFQVDSGFNYTENIGHAVVFHAQDGSRIGCGTLL